MKFRVPIKILYLYIDAQIIEQNSSDYRESKVFFSTETEYINYQYCALKVLNKL